MRFLRKAEYLKHRPSGLQFWEGQWSKQVPASQLEQLKKDRYAPLMRRWIMNTTGKPGIVLDGGCGSGKYLTYFNRLGYDVVGLDFSMSAIQLAREVNPSFALIQASVLALPFHNESFDYYLSLGVLEHFIEGPEEGVMEAYRVLKDEGMLFLSVPYMNNLRTVGERLENWRSKLSGGQKRLEGEFYQYYFTREELSSILASFNFQVLEACPVNQELGLRRVVPFVKKNRILNYLTLKLGELIKYMFPWFSPHMVLLVCKKGDLNFCHG